MNFICGVYIMKTRKTITRTLTLKWNQQHNLHVRVRIYTHTLHTRKRLNVTPPSLANIKRSVIVSMISTTAKHSHSGSINQTLRLVVIGAPNRCWENTPCRSLKPWHHPAHHRHHHPLLEVLGLLFQESDRPEGWEAPLGGFQCISQLTTHFDFHHGLVSNDFSR